MTSPVTTSAIVSSQPVRPEEIVSTVHRVLGNAEKFIPLHEPEFKGNEWNYLKQCVDTGWVSSVGAFVDRFEKDLADYTGVAHAVATANGTAALHMCLLLVGVQADDEVLLPTLTFVATANAVSYIGAKPHFVDSEPSTLAVDATRLDAHLHDCAHISDGKCINRQTGAVIRALVVMHPFGHPADMDALMNVAERWHLKLVEDAAESLGSYYKGRHTGNHGHVAALSFNGNKVITTGGGGAILTNDYHIGCRAKHLTTTARIPHRWNFVHDEIGYNYRLPNLNAALGCAQLERLSDMIARKRILAERYAEAFRNVSGVEFLREPAYGTSNYWLNTIILDADSAVRQEEVLAALNDAGYMSRPVWTLMHLLPMYAEFPRADLAIAESLANRVVNIPSSPRLVY